MSIQIVLESLAISFAVTALLGPMIIPLLRRLKFGQYVRDDGPARHLIKTGTPTMGGVIFLAGITVAGAIMSFHYTDGLLVLAVTLGFGLIGFLDDYIKIALKRPMGLRAREKLIGQLLVGLLLVWVSVSVLGRDTEIWIPFSGFFTSGGFSVDLGFWGYLIFVLFVLLGSTNAVNLTDGLDGLASSVTTITATAFTLVALIEGYTGVALLMAAVVGGCLGFLLFNHYPAKVFMGDTGSLALGGALGAAAVITHTELFLLVIGFVYVLEALSVIIQVFSFHVFHRRVFKMSPLHHHFELCNWTENNIVILFTAITLVCSVLGIVALYQFK